MNLYSRDVVGDGRIERIDLPGLDGGHVPNTNVVAFCETQGGADAIAAAAGDRRMARAKVEVRIGGMPRAVELYRDSPSPDLLVLETRASREDLLSDLERLAEVCDCDTKVLVIGASNDVMLYRELLDRGVDDYLAAPADARSIIAAIARIYRDSETARLGKTYAFIGAKGGVGSSTLAHNVACALAREFKSEVVLADMDLPFGTAGLDFNVDAEKGIADAVDDSGRLDEMLLGRLLVKRQEHLSLLTAPAALGRAYDLEEQAFEHMLELARGRASSVVLDVPHVWTAWARRTLVSADQVVIVAAPDLANLRNTKSLVEFLMQARPNDGPPKLVLNPVGVPKRPEIAPAEFAAAVGLEPIAAIAFDPALFGLAANKGEMIAEVSPRSPACAAVSGIARSIAGRDEEGRKSFAARLLQMFAPGRRPARSAAA